LTLQNILTLALGGISVCVMPHAIDSLLLYYALCS